MFYQAQERKPIIPGIIPGLLAAFQMILWLTILGLESGSIYYDAGRGTIYAGFWCSTIFLITWVSMLCYLCCNKSSGFGIYLVVINIINSIFAIILIVFTSLFVNNPCLCFNILCKIPPWDGIFDYTDYPYFGDYRCTTRTVQKLPVLKGLLSCAVLMFVSSILFIIAYIIGYILLHSKRVSTPPIQPTEVSVYQQSSVINPIDQYERPYLYQGASESRYYSQTTSTPMEIHSHKF